MQILFTDRALPTIRGMDQMGGGGGGGGGLSLYRPKIMVAYVFILLPRFIDWTRVAVLCMPERSAGSQLR